MASLSSPLAWLARADLETDLQRARSLANWLDTKFSIAGYRFGFETVIGLLPGLGDTLTTLIGLFPIFIARRHKLGKAVQLRMAWNLLLEWLVGLIPWVGDIFDTTFKANVRNVRLLEKAVAKRRGAVPNVF